MSARPDPRATRDALTQHNQVLWRALQKVQQGDIEGAQSVLGAAQGAAPTLGEVFRLYQDELETQAQQLRESQQRAEQALAWFARLYRDLPVAAVMVDAQGLVVDANEQARAELGLAPLERAAPVPLRRLMADAAGELKLVAALARAVHSESALLEQVAMRGPGGQSRVADLRITRLPPRAQAHDQPVALCVIHDRTAQMEAQRARDAAAQAERARDVAQASIQAKSTMMSRLSHELRTPLNAVIGFSHLLLSGDDALTSRQRHRLGLIQEAGRHLLALVEDVLLVNRLGAGALGLDLRTVSLPEVVADVLALQQPQIEARELRVLSTSEGGGAPAALAHADPRRVREILVNLVSNAIKYNRHGGDLSVQCRHQGDRSVVSVRDTGIGLTPQQRSHLFEPFNRLGAEAGPVEGTGLGLNIARGLAQAMGGDIEVESEPGLGCTFSLWLPAAAADDAAALAALAAEAAAPGAGPGLFGGHQFNGR